MASPDAFLPPETGAPRLRLGVSACLLGEPVRYDQGHRRQRFLTDRLDRWTEWVRVCPEMEVGMGTPRPTIRLEMRGRAERLVAPDTGVDFTDAMAAWAAARASQLRPLDLDGYVLKSRSPSCGIAGLPVFAGGEAVRRDGVGAWARVLRGAIPGLPVIDEERLRDPHARDGFLSLVFTRARWRRVRATGDAGEVATFHRAHALLLAARSGAGARGLGRIAATEAPLADYERLLHRMPGGASSISRHAVVLRALVERCDPRWVRELRDALAGFAAGRIDLVALRAAVRARWSGAAPDAAERLYLEPYPDALADPA